VAHRREKCTMLCRIFGSFRSSLKRVMFMTRLCMTRAF
jgi:hypothetical protein